MHAGLSTHLVLPQRLTPALMNTLLGSGATQIELFAARHHFDYTDRYAVREMASWFRSNEVVASMHMPLYSHEDGQEWSRHSAPSLNLISQNKGDRILAMDEAKRALEAAEQIPMRFAVIHLGMNEDRWSTRAIDDSLTALEHLKAFASPLGVELLLENLSNEVATPEHLVEIVQIGHFDGIGFCLDVGHAHIAIPALPETPRSEAKSGIAQAFAVFGDRLRELHLHDNGGMRDAHLWPGEGSIDWKEVARLSSAMAKPPVGMLEIAHELGYDTSAAVLKSRQAFESLSL
ncbi:MAG: sugar phosphate isomerase/epimerase [Acidobacteriaceae bacterium]|nr:sugar phosphate isomerase/epimerase [Acidobacteriaceae bacterium]